MANDNMNSPKDAAMAILAKAQKLLDNKSSAAIEDIKVEDMKKSAQYTSGLHTVAYYGLDKHSAQQAALAVLAKSQDLLSATVSAKTDGFQKSAEAESGMHKVEYYSQPFEKAETGHEKGIHTQSDPSQKSRVMMGTSKAGSQMPLSRDPKTRAEDVHDAKKVHQKVRSEMDHDVPHRPLANMKSEMLCSEHALGKTEGVQIVKAESCTKCMGKSEWSDLYEDLAKMEKSEKEDENEIGTKFVKSDTENKKAPSNDLKPKIEEKPIERDNQDFETKPGHAPENDHREATTLPQPAQNPAAQGQGSNPPAGTKPVNGKGIHKLSFFMGHRHHKNAAKKFNPAG